MKLLESWWGYGYPPCYSNILPSNKYSNTKHSWWFSALYTGIDRNAGESGGRLLQT